jgi:hypothetical protein
VVVVILIIVVNITVVVFFSQAINTIVEDLMTTVAKPVVRLRIVAERGRLLKGRASGSRSGYRSLVFDAIVDAIAFIVVGLTSAVVR